MYDATPVPNKGYHPTIAVLTGSRVSAVFDLAKFDEYAESAVYVQGVPLHPSNSALGVAAAFRSAGDGAGCLFAIVLRSGSAWKLALLRRTTQGTLRITANGQKLILCSANDPKALDCTWCSHKYQQEVFSLDEQTGRYRLSSKIPLSGRMDPRVVVRDLLHVE